MSRIAPSGSSAGPTSSPPSPGRADCALWQFRRANKLATLSWQSTKAGFNKEILRLENLALDGAPTCASSPAALNAYTEYIYQESVRAWKALEDKYWVQFGSGF